MFSLLECILPILGGLSTCNEYVGSRNINTSVRKLTRGYWFMLKPCPCLNTRTSSSWLGLMFSGYLVFVVVQDLTQI